MKEAELIAWLRQQQRALDIIIANASREFHEEKKESYDFGYDLGECQFESYNLIRQADLCYDRPNTAFVYSLWYHCRRVNTFLSYFARAILDNTQRQLDIFDLGAGTGAVQWAIGLVYHKMKEDGIQVPKIKIVNVDSSPFMLYYSRDFLWKHFTQQYKHCLDFSSDIEYEVNSWANSKRANVANPWIIASYLFDISDTSMPGKENTEYRESVKSGFDDLVKTFNPATIFLLTSDQPPKRKLLNELKLSFNEKGYNQKEITYPYLILDGVLSETSRFRKELYNYYQTQLTTTEGQALARMVEWKDNSFVGTILSKTQTSMEFVPQLENEVAKKIRLYNCPITVRREIILNDEQKNASEHSERPTIITGPAGCGKSVVITERIKNLVETKKYSPELRILVTTFNKQLMSYLGKWLADLLDRGKAERVGNNFRFNNSTDFNIRLLHFDVLPTRIGNLYGDLVFNSSLRSIASQAIAAIKLENKITTNKHDKVLEPDYIIEEYHRIIYGLQYVKELDFLVSERIGRPKLKRNGDNRRYLWMAVLKFLSILESKNLDSIVSRRHKFLKKLQQKEVTTRFTHIFVDEFQDCTQADYLIFDLLLMDPNNIVVAGDISQAIQIGNVADIPRVRTELMVYRKTYILKGSYRLPFRISECISKITENVKNGNIITPYKGAPPGARPIVVYAGTPHELTSKIAKIYPVYRAYGLERITILESDPEIFRTLRAAGIPCETDTILKLKGMEKTCVLWSTRVDIEYKQEVAEFVNTILSRTSGILLIIITSQTLPKYQKILKILRADRLIHWDEETKQRFHDIIHGPEVIDSFEEED